MARSRHHSDKKKRSPADLRSIFVLWMVICTIVGIAGIASSIYWESKLQAQSHDQFRIDIGSLISQTPKPNGKEVTQVLDRWEKALGEQHVEPEIIRDLSIALLVAVFVTFAIELYAGLRLRTQIANDVLEAAFEKIVPEEIYDEVRDNIFRSPVVRRDWVVDIKIVDRSSDLYKGVENNV
jgi:hypothetical protein